MLALSALTNEALQDALRARHELIRQLKYDTSTTSNKAFCRRHMARYSLSQREVALKIGWQQAYVSMFLNSKMSRKRPWTLTRL
jgi:hypothetical protein